MNMQIHYLKETFFVTKTKNIYFSRRDAKLDYWNYFVAI